MVGEPKNKEVIRSCDDGGNPFLELDFAGSGGAEVDLAVKEATKEANLKHNFLCGKELPDCFEKLALF
ncbi:hypothetical protein DEO72_LG3g2318 [Vigna unguiculata]|uniref:Uncharacterized protein n=1 Tax=Vigna unguiculata TaxID=3917 RepID=A0A4D6LGY4_VIGUN|nr:hypothetical protein DEO72_LG3g2318 [Vigna unguiculata]